MERKLNGEALPPAAAILRRLGSSRSLALLLGKSRRGVEMWRAGRKPSRANRQLIADRLAIPESLWEPAASPLEAELSRQLVGVLRCAMAAAVASRRAATRREAQ